eukprot:2878281-Amphidinium_carterae.6
MDIIGVCVMRRALAHMYAIRGRVADHPKKADPTFDPETFLFPDTGNAEGVNPLHPLAGAGAPVRLA